MHFLIHLSTLLYIIKDPNSNTWLGALGCIYIFSILIINVAYNKPELICFLHHNIICCHENLVCIVWFYFQIENWGPRWNLAQSNLLPPCNQRFVTCFQNYITYVDKGTTVSADTEILAIDSTKFWLWMMGQLHLTIFSYHMVSITVPWP